MTIDDRAPDDDIDQAPPPDEPPTPTTAPPSREIVDRSGETIGRRGPQHDIHAERSIAGAVLLYGHNAVTKLRDSGLEPSDVVDPTSQAVISAAYDLHDADPTSVIDAITIADELAGAVDHLAAPDHDDGTANGRHALIALQAAASTPTGAAAHAAIVQRWARTRAIGYAIADAAEAHRLDDPPRLHRALEQINAAQTSIDPAARTRLRPIDGAEWILDAPVQVPTIWGDGDQVAWAKGESLMICGPSGVGKTTLGQQLALARIGLGPTELLGLTVAVDDRPLLYIAADRPDQARRSLARMVTPADRDELAERFLVWRGPPPFDLLTDQRALADFATSLNVGTVVIDSLKDIVPDLSKDEVGSRYNIARQHLLAAGIDAIELHHQRKSRSDGSKPKHLDDVYGSTWITAGAGSVFVIWGEAGDPVVELLHLKQPSEQIGPHKIVHHAHAGTSTIEGAVDLLDVLSRAHLGMSAKAAAGAIFDTTDATRNQVEKARRRLDSLVRQGRATRRVGTKGGTAGGDAALYFYAYPEPS